MPEAPPTAEQRRAIKAALDDPRQKLGDVHYVLSQKWWAAWRQHVGYEKGDSPSSLDLAGLSLTRTSSVDEGPGPITNEPLGVLVQNELILREGLVERDDYALVPSSAWEKLARWYGRDHAFQARVVQGASSSELTIEVFPLRFDLRDVNDDGTAGAHHASIHLSRSDPLKKALGKLTQSENSRVWLKPAAEDAFAGEKTGAPRRLTEAFWNTNDWRLLEGDEEAMVGGVPAIFEDRDWPRWGCLIESRRSSSAAWPRDARREAWRKSIKVGDAVDAKDSEGRWFDARVVEIEHEKVKVHFNGWSSRWDFWFLRDGEGLQPLLSQTDDWRRLRVGDAVEMRNDGEKALWYEGRVRELEGTKVQVVPVARGTMEPLWCEVCSESICKLGTHIKAKRKEVTMGPRARSGSYDGRSRSHVRGAPPARGAVGLSNLGNTCFMNSMLQCLSHTRPLTDYFLRDEDDAPKYVQDINEKNPLGCGGNLARAYADFVRDAWSGSYSTVVPAQLKKAVSINAPQFSGYQQHDSQELMTYMLDGLHEDLNGVRDKPYVEDVESKGEPDEVLAEESWKRFGLRNKSVVVDHCYGQQKSHITCGKCGHESTTFGVYNAVHLPLPAAGARRVSCTLFRKEQGPLKVIVSVQSKDTVSVLKNALARQVYADGSVDGGALDLCDVWGHRVYRTFADAFCVEHIKASDELVAFELGSRERAVDVLCGRRSRYASSDRQAPYELFGRPLRIAVDATTTCGDVRRVVREATQRFAKDYTLQISAAAGTRYESDLPADEELLPKDVATLTLEFTGDEGYDTGEADKVEEHASCADDGHRDINLVDCFRKLAEKEQLGETEQWYCGKCKEHSRAFKKLDLWSTPEILILHLKRFQYAQNTYFVHRQKLDDRVAFPVVNLDLSSCVQGPTAKNAQYDLYAVSEHSGGLGGGHYTATAKDDNTGVWYHYNDSVVSRAEKNGVVTPQAYVLFYKRRPSKSS